MRIKREVLLADLNLVKAGLSPREYIEQSSCFVFRNKQVMTFNDEVACCKGIDLDIKGAVQATSLLAILEKLPDEDLDAEVNDRGELEFRGKRRSFAVTMEAKIHLPIDRVEEPKEDGWKELPKSFAEAVGLVQHCVGRDETRFMLTCVHIHPKGIEACDNLQVLRCRVDELPFKESVLIRGTSLQPIVELGMSEVAMTKSWTHFRNGAGLVFSCRKYTEDYPSLSRVMEFEGRPLSLPKSLVSSVECATVFANDKTGDPMVRVSLREGAIRVIGEGLTGWFKEARRLNYNGPPLEFMIAPELLKKISEKYSECEINGSKLRATGGTWTYLTVLGKVTDDEPEEEPKKAKKKKPVAED